MKKIVILMVGFLVMSCGSKKSVSTYVKEKDSISYVLPSDNTFVVSNLCDTLRSPLNVVKTISTGVSDTKLEIKGNVLTLSVKTDTIFKEVVKIREKVVKETKEVPYIPKWFKTLFWIVAALLLTVIVFPKVASAIKTMVLRLLGLPS